MVRIRDVIQEFEAKFHPTELGAALAGRARGKAEWKVYGDGTRQCKVWLSGLTLSDGALLQLSVSGQPLAAILVRQGRSHYKRESERGENVPVVESRQVLQISYAGQVILEGELYPE